MSKLEYPSEGIYGYCKDHLDSCTSDLSRAISSCNFDVPSGFQYYNYLNGLDNVIGDYYKEINSISSKMLKTHNNYEMLASDLEASIKKKNISKIKDRDRVIL